MLGIVVRSGVSFAVLFGVLLLCGCGCVAGCVVFTCLCISFGLLCVVCLFGLGFVALVGGLGCYLGFVWVLFMCCSDSDFMYSCGLGLGWLWIAVWFILLNGVCLNVGLVGRGLFTLV